MCTLQVLEHAGRRGRSHRNPETGLSTLAATGSAATHLDTDGLAVPFSVTVDVDNNYSSTNGLAAPELAVLSSAAINSDADGLAVPPSVTVDLDINCSSTNGVDAGSLADPSAAAVHLDTDGKSAHGLAATDLDSNGLAASDGAVTGSAAGKPATAAACVVDFDADVRQSTLAAAAAVDVRSRDAAGTLEVDADCDVSVTTTTLVRDSTLDSVTSTSCGYAPPPPGASLVDPTRVHVVSTAADMEPWNAAASDLFPDATANSRRLVADDDVIPEPEVDAGAICTERVLSNSTPEPEIRGTGCGAVSEEVGCDDVTPEPEVMVHPVESRSSCSELTGSVVEDDGARQYLYDDIDGHYSPAGRGYPHGFHQLTPRVPRIHAPAASPQSPDDLDHVIPGLSLP